MPIVIGKAASPSGFKGLQDKKNPLGVPYYSNAMMNFDILFDVLILNGSYIAMHIV